MANNYLITGYWGEPHVTAENDRGIHAGLIGTGRVVLPVGEQFKAEYIGNNTIRMYDGKLMDNGAAAGIPAGEYVDLQIANAGQGMKRNDLIVFQYSLDASTMIERGSFVVVQGNETSGTPVDPALTQANLLSGKATLDQMALWRVTVSGATIAAPVKAFELRENVSSKNFSTYFNNAHSDPGIRRAFHAKPNASSYTTTDTSAKFYNIQVLCGSFSYSFTVDWAIVNEHKSVNYSFYAFASEGPAYSRLSATLQADNNIKFELTSGVHTGTNSIADVVGYY